MGASWIGVCADPRWREDLDWREVLVRTRLDYVRWRITGEMPHDER